VRRGCDRGRAGRDKIHLRQTAVALVIRTLLQPTAFLSSAQTIVQESSLRPLGGQFGCQRKLEGIKTASTWHVQTAKCGRVSGASPLLQARRLRSPLVSLLLFHVGEFQNRRVLATGQCFDLPCSARYSASQNLTAARYQTRQTLKVHRLCKIWPEEQLCRL
jgi:hypothetical protein